MTVESEEKTTLLHSGLGELFLSLILGTFAFLLVVGPNVLDPRNIAWLKQGDASTNYLGWAFFRKGPWTLPIGLNPNYGLEIGNSIVFSDSNPLLALLFKPVAPFLSEPFQYIGLWLLACFILQSWFALKLVKLASSNITATSLAALLFVFAPAMLYRLHGHYNLVAHFFILAALFMTLKPSPPGRQTGWGLLLMTSVLTHAYLFLMTFVLWGGDFLDRLLRGQIQRSRAITEFLSLALLTAFAIWQAGYLAIDGSEVTPGLGLYSMNFLAPVDPDAWSYFLRDIPNGNPEQYEGFNYLGLGVIFLGILLVPHQTDFKRQLNHQIHQRPGLILVTVTLSLLSLSNTPCIGEMCHTFEWPAFLEKGLSIFRATGRLFWPAYYLIFLIIIGLALATFGEKKMIPLLGLCLLLQMADTSKAWRGIRSNFMQAKASNWRSHLVDAFWTTASTKYAKMLWLYPENNRPGWQDVAAFAERKGLATNSVYLGRVSKFSLESAKLKAERTLRSGSFEKDTLYILDESLVLACAMHLHNDRDLLARVDGLTVVAPGWKTCVDCGRDLEEIDVSKYYPPALAAGSLIEFGVSQSGLKYLGTGWSSTEPNGTWSDGKMAHLLLPLKTGEETSLILEVKPFIGGALSKQIVAIRIDEGSVSEFTLSEGKNTRIKLEIPPRSPKAPKNGRMLDVELQFPTATRPLDVGIIP